MINKPKNKQKILSAVVGFILAVAVILADISPANAKSVDAALLPLFAPFAAQNTAAVANDVFLSAPVNQPEQIVVDYQARRAEQAQRLDAYFIKRGMPLYGYGAKFVAVAEKYDLDWRLLPAIGVRESSGGKRLMNNNPFGWGSAQIEFDNFGEAIEEVAKNIAGYDEDTARYYRNTSTYEKLWAYNGTVIRTYPDEVIRIMEMF